MLLAFALLLLPLARAFIGITIEMYNPSCAYACRSVIGSAVIDCGPEADHADPGHHAMAKRHGHASPITPACRSKSVPFLTTLAYCIRERCYPEFNPPREKVEWYWYKFSTGDETVAPMWGWQEAYDQIHPAPNTTYDSEEGMINGTILVNKEAWQAEKRSMEAFEWQETLHSRYAVTIFLVGVGIPVLFTTLTYLPFTHSLALWLKPRFIYPTLLSRHVEPLFRVFHPPTLGQALFIGLITVMTIVFSAAEYTSIQPNTWFAKQSWEIMAYLANRTGVLAMALLPLTILFAGRNNILLWLSNWSHGTYLLVHRWVARLCLLQILLHSAIELAYHVQLGDYADQLPELYWIWGCIGTVACVIIVIAAQWRRYYYEIFLITHIILAIMLVAGTWYHVEYLFERKWGYEQWIYACCAIWFVDRLIRLGRVLKIGIKKASLTPIGNEVVRVDIPGVRWPIMPGQHAYLFLPATRKWAPWENHPFSVIPTSLITPLANSDTHRGEKPTPTPVPSSTPDIEKLQPESSSSSSESGEGSVPVLRSDKANTTSGITMFVKCQKGLTASFSPAHLSALLDGPYRNVSSQPVLSTARLILFAGGIGITGIFPFVHAHPNVKLYWSVRPEQAALIDELSPSIPAHVERSVLIGGRNNIEVALAEEVKAGWGLVGVVVCGPGSMCDEMRKRVSWLGKRYSTKWELDVEAFLW